MNRHAGWRFVLGEVAITTIGILIAVAVNAWWQDRQDRRTELEALREMRVVLAGDVDDLREDLARYGRVDRSTRLLLDRMHRGLPPAPGMDTLFGAQLIYRSHLSNATAYESLRSRGLGIIADDSLRLAVIDFYGLQNSTVALWNQIDTRQVDEDVRPFFRTHFRLRPGSATTPRGAVPLDYAALARDPAFEGLLATRLETLGAVIRTYEQAIARGERLRALLDRRIARLR